jgi:uncharacterized phage-associated protein
MFRRLTFDLQSEEGFTVPPYKAKSIANAFITLANKDGYEIDPMQLQKHLYYANGYFLAENDGQPLINEFFEAWDYGPVVPTVYYEFREYADQPIKRFAYTFDENSRRRVAAPVPFDDSKASAVIKWVWEHYRDFSGPQLSKMTHKEGAPWAAARKRAHNSLMRNERLEIHELREYFGKLVG